MKNYTIISLDNWGYNQYIVDELNSRPNTTCNHINFHKFIYKYPSKFHRIGNFFLKTFFNYNLKRVHLNKHITIRLKELGLQDAILVIKGDFLSTKTIKIAKKQATNLIALFNDNVKRYPRIKKVYHNFDHVFSFEKDDVKQYNFKFITNYIYHTSFDKKEANTIIFNISSKDKRFDILVNISEYCAKKEIDQKIIIVGNHSEENSNLEFSNQKYSINEVLDLMKASKIVLDVQRKGQSGLTFRVFEAMGLQKKVITTNSDIVNYDLYDPNNILVLQPDNIEIPESFLNSPYKKLPENVFYKYTIKNWVNTVFDIQNLMNQEVEKTYQFLKNGQTILYPTDTVWGIGCDATNFNAIKEIYNLKQREESKTMIVLVDSIDMLKNYINELPIQIEKIIAETLKPLTIIYDTPKHLSENIIASDNTIAIRIVQDDFCQKLIQKLGKPLISTSANISGQSTPKSFSEISQDIIKGVDYVVNLHRDKKSLNPSSIIKLSNTGLVKVIRK